MKKAIIIGASSGIGKALAEELADQGYSLGLVSRRLELLQQLQEGLSTPSFIKQIDITQTEQAMEELSLLIQEMDGVDLIVINAGTGFSDSNMDWTKEKITIDTNVVGFVAMANVAYRYFLECGRGHIVGISSIAAHIVNGNTPAYSASKACISNYMRGMRLNARKANAPIIITDIQPGFVDTPLIKDRKKIFWMASAEKAAKQIYAAIKKKKKHAYITKRWRIAAWIAKVLPETFY